MMKVDLEKENVNQNIQMDSRMKIKCQMNDRPKISNLKETHKNEKRTNFMKEDPKVDNEYPIKNVEYKSHFETQMNDKVTSSNKERFKNEKRVQCQDSKNEPKTDNEYKEGEVEKSTDKGIMSKVGEIISDVGEAISEKLKI